jgi:hypothetical protein
MEFPPEWNVFPLEDFEAAAARTQGAAGMELMAQMRPNGRLLDHVRVATGGAEILEAEVRLNDLFPIPSLGSWKAKIQFWARDTAIRRNMTSSVWKDAYSMIQSQEIQVEDERSEQVDMAEVIGELDCHSAGRSAVIRHAVVIGEDQRMALELQSLPVSLATVNGRPSYRG